MSGNKAKFTDELIKNATLLGTPGKGILASDESTGAGGRCLADANIGVENNVESRRALCELLFCTPDALQYFSGVILTHETLYQKTASGKLFVDVIKEAGVLPGVKVDKGTVEHPGTHGEHLTVGLDGLGARCALYYTAGARFAKWRALIKIGPDKPSQLAINDNARALSRYASICQANGLVPIIEPLILVTGSYNIVKCDEITKGVLSACYKALTERNVLEEGTLLKMNVVAPGSDAEKVAPEVVYTLTALLTRVPGDVPAVFLSRGLSDEEATVNLNAINKLEGWKPWSLSFWFGNPLQTSTLKAWSGKNENVEKAREIFLAKCKANHEAALGKYHGVASLSEGASESQHLKD